MVDSQAVYPNISILSTMILVLTFFNVIFGVIAINMARKRGFKTIPAFFAGLFGSFVALFIIAMFPGKD